MPSVRRSSLAALAFAVALLGAGGARAQFDAGVSGTTAFPASDFFIGVQQQATANLSDFQVARFFNKARCDCSQTVYLFFTLIGQGFVDRPSVQAANPDGTIEFWIGSSCNVNDGFRQNRCIPLKSETLAQFLQAGSDTITTDARVLSFYPGTGVGTVTFDDAGVPIDTTTTGTTPVPLTGSPDCLSPTGQQFTQNIYALVSNAGIPGSYDTIVSRPVTIDLVPPPSPDSSTISVEGGDQALVVNWAKLDTAIYTDLFGYQILCNRGGSLQVFDTGAFSAGFQTCPTTMPGMDIADLDPNFICSPLLTASASSYRVKILQNDIVYGVAVVSVDNNGNASTPDTFYGTPVKTKSFYDVYRDGNTGSTQDLPGTATGGFCAVGSGGPRRATTVAAVALGLGAIGVALARRRRRR